MTDWTLVAGVVYRFLIAAVLFVALGRISATMSAQRDPANTHLRHLVHTEDRIGVFLTIVVAICTVFLAFLLADHIFRDAIHKLVEILTLQ